MTLISTISFDAWPLALLARVTVVLLVAWIGNAAIRARNPRWRILLWRTAALAIVLAAGLSLAPPLVTLRVLPPLTQAIPTDSIRGHEPTSDQVPTPAPFSQGSAVVASGEASDGTRSREATSGSVTPTATSAAPQESRATAFTSRIDSNLAAQPQEVNSAGTRYLSVFAFGAWILGLGFAVTRFVLGNVQLQRQIREAENLPVELTGAAAAVAARLNISRQPEIRFTHKISTPCTTGIHRPVILLPTEFRGRESQASFQAVLAHEMAHVAGNDLRWNAALELLAALLWFHPLAWRMRLAHVDACDERCDAVATGITADAQSYAQLLARIALQVMGRMPSASLPMARRSGVVRRLAVLTAGKGSERLSRRRVGAALLAGIVGAVFIGTLGVQRATADKLAVTATREKPTTETTDKADATAPDADQPLLSGRITDDTGAPVTDATVSITGENRVADTRINSYGVKTDANGRYAFNEAINDDTYRLQIDSKAWVGITNWNELPQLRLTPLSTIVRDFKLSRACRIRIRVVDEVGKPVSRAQVYVKSSASESLGSSPSATTDREGRADIGGLQRSDAPYIFGVMSKGHALGKLVRTVNDPDAIPKETIVLAKGVEVSGTALCSDGKAAAGWSIFATPAWWMFGVYPNVAVIKEDGAFTLTHITPGDKYNISISIPEGNGMSRSENVALGVPLPPAEGMLKVTARVPSPQSMAEISGTFKFSGDKPHESIMVDASSDDRQNYGSTMVRPGETKFRVAPLPPGRYTITVNSTEVEEVRLPNITAPTKDLEVAVKVVGRPKFVGRVVDDAGKPVANFRVRIIRAGYLRGPSYVQDPQWKEFDDGEGKFEIDLVGPGIYQALVAADGFAESRSESVNTDKNWGTPITIKLAHGVTLHGRVADEQGQPVDGASVQLISVPPGAAGMPMPVGTLVRSLIAQFGADGPKVTTSQGEFQLANVPTGSVLLRVTHPEFCFADSGEITVGNESTEIKPIVLTRGGTVRGTVYDVNGQPQPNVTLFFQDAQGYGGRDDQTIGRFGTAVSDVNGVYEVKHLPSQICYVHRNNEWEANGVVRTAVLPANGEVRTLDLGGPRGVTGRLLTNGKPVANTRIQFGGESPHFGTFKEFAETDADGKFTLSRPPAGRRTLWYLAPGRRNDWIRVGQVTIDDATTDLGQVDARLAAVTINVKGLTGEGLATARVSLVEPDPRWLFTGNTVGVAEPTAKVGDPSFPFRSVPVGTHEALLQRADGISLRQAINVTGQEGQQSFDLNWPDAAGSLVVQFAPGWCPPDRVVPPNLRSADGNVHGYMQVTPDAKEVRYDRLPAGDYYLTDQDVRDAKHLLDFKIAANETTKLEVNSTNYVPTKSDQGFAQVQCFNGNGIPLTGCEVKLTGKNAVQFVTQRDHETTVIAEPGQYALTVSFPGYKTVQRTVDIGPVDRGSPGRSREVVVFLTQ